MASYEKKPGSIYKFPDPGDQLDIYVINEHHVRDIQRMETCMRILLNLYSHKDHLRMDDHENFSKPEFLFHYTFRGFALVLNSCYKEQYFWSTVEVPILNTFKEVLGIEVNKHGLYKCEDPSRTSVLLNNAISYSIGRLFIEKNPPVGEMEREDWEPFVTIAKRIDSHFGMFSALPIKEIPQEQGFLDSFLE